MEEPECDSAPTATSDGALPKESAEPRRVQQCFQWPGWFSGMALPSGFAVFSGLAVCAGWPPPNTPGAIRSSNSPTWSCRRRRRTGPIWRTREGQAAASRWR